MYTNGSNILKQDLRKHLNQKEHKRKTIKVQNKKTLIKDTFS